MDSKLLNLIRLGDEYQEQFRMYLLGEAKLPENARLFVHVWAEEQTDFTTMSPCTFRIHGVRRHKFCIPGITFVLFLGKEVPRRHDVWALNSSQGPFMWLDNWKDDSLFGSFLDAIKGSKPSAALRSKLSIVAKQPRQCAE
jgi:hypothetical protein